MIQLICMLLVNIAIAAVFLVPNESEVVRNCLLAINLGLLYIMWVHWDAFVAHFLTSTATPF